MKGQEEELYNGMKIDVDNVVVLEFGGFTELVEKVKSKKRVEPIEEKTIINYLYQENRINGGFSSQGRVMLEIG